MSDGRLKIGSDFLKIGSMYLRIGPAPATGRLFFRGESDGSSINSLSISVSNPLANGNAFFVMVVCIDTGGTPPDSPTIDNAGDFASTNNRDDFTVVSGVSGSGWRMTLWDVRGPTGEPDPFTIDVSTNTATFMAAAVFEVSNSLGDNVLQIAHGYTTAPGTNDSIATLGSALTAPSRTYAFYFDDVSATPDTDFTVASGVTPGVDIIIGLESDAETSVNIGTNASGDVYPVFLLELEDF